ncbi:MAG: sensor histidine kinase [Thermoleophilaceae bacterium]
MGLVFGALGAFLYLRLGTELDQALAARLRAESTRVGLLVRDDADDLGTAGESPLADIGTPYAQILTPSGRVVDASPLWRSVRLVSHAGAAEAFRRGELAYDWPEGLGAPEPLRVRVAPISSEGRSLLMVVGVSLEEREEALESLVTLLLVGGPLALLLASAAGYAVVAGALRPVDAMRRAAAEIVGTEPGKRLPVPVARDELARLGRTLNEMLERQEATFARERTFVADASHELRTPLAILRAELELALRAGRSPEELVAALRSATEETDRLARLAENLLIIARSDHAQLTPQLELRRAGELLAQARRAHAPRFAEQGRDLAFEVAEGLELWVDPLQIECALGNLLDNALHHGRGKVELSAEREGQEARIVVADAGPGFPEHFLPSAFERFARADSGRSGGGTGLGLSIVAAVARAHGGRVGARNKPRGAEVWFSLPTTGPSTEQRRSFPASRPAASVETNDQSAGPWRTCIRLTSSSTGLLCRCAAWRPRTC